MTLCTAHQPTATCQGVEGTPECPWRRYLHERRHGLVVPPSVSRWTEADRLRQIAAELRIDEQRRAARGESAPEPPAYPWEACR